MQTEKTYDAWLIYRIKTGDKQAFRLLAERWTKKLISHIYFLVRDSEVAKDIAQDTWSVVIRKIWTLKEPEYFKIWIFKIARNKSADWIKHEQKKRVVNNDLKNESLENQYVLENENSNIEKLQTAMKKLPVEQQHILNLFYHESCNIREIAKILNIPVGTVKSRLFKAREHLKNIIKIKNKNS